MAIRNIMEDIVLTSIDEILKEEKILVDADKYKQDIAAYTLNRIPPKYITSERGILHGMLESRFIFQQRTDIILIIHEAIEVIKSRRDIPRSTISESMSSRVLFFPHIIGEVLEETTFSVIPDVMVSLLYNGEPAPMVDASWENPYRTNKGTLGYYHFWPDADSIVKDEKTNEIPFTIKLEHKNLKDKIVECTLPIKNDFSLNRSRTIPIVLMQLKDGVDVSFLYK